MAAFALAATGAHAAQITDAHRSLQVVIELVDSNPLAGDEVFDIQGPTSPLNATYRGLAQTGTTQTTTPLRVVQRWIPRWTWQA